MAIIQKVLEKLRRTDDLGSESLEQVDEHDGNVLEKLRRTDDFRSEYVEYGDDTKSKNNGKTKVY